MKLKYIVLIFSLAFLGMPDTNAQDAKELKFAEMDKSPMDAAHYPRRAAFKNYLSDDDPDRSLKIKVLYCRPNKSKQQPDYMIKRPPKSIFFLRNQVRFKNLKKKTAG